MDAAEWGEQAGRVAAHFDGVIDHIQIGNEPDGGWAFFGDAAGDYARMLSAAYDEIHFQAPGTKVVLGPTMRLNAEGADWLDQVFRTPGANAAQKPDVASMHLRGWMSQMTDAMHQRRAFLAAAATCPCGSPSTATPPTAPGSSTPPSAVARIQASYPASSLPLLARPAPPRCS